MPHWLEEEEEEEGGLNESSLLLASFLFKGACQLEEGIYLFLLLKLESRLEKTAVQLLAAAETM